MPTLTLGLTGGLASGKSFIGNELERLGAYMIRADQLGHEALLPSGAAYANTVGHFGSAILNSSGEIDRARLGSIVFPDPEALSVLTGFIHPVVFARQAEMLAAAPAGALVVIEAAILVETGSYRSLDRLAVACCSFEQQRERAMRRPGAVLADITARLARQLPISDKVAVADFVIDTSGSESNTLRQTRSVFDTLKEELRQLCDSGSCS